MIEVVVIVESRMDAVTATKLAERVLVEKIDWLEPESLEHLFKWTGLESGTEHSCWKDIGDIMNRAEKEGIPKPRFLGHGKTGVLKADGAIAMKTLKLIKLLHRKKSRKIAAVLFIRDLDNQPERRQGIEQARIEQIDEQPRIEIVIGTADRMREAWVLNGFSPLNVEENQILEQIKTKLNFHPCEEAHKLRSNSFAEPDRFRNPKVVVEQLTGGDMSREQQCWEETDLEILRSRGTSTGLSEYLKEVEQRLISIFDRADL
ncbi:hypothetical protein [Chamaesiphon sp. VAR_69_metabat_338]|uniref:hypothetical protein n=1 Tax=Chamaesiphon sp. VAR_69_metabat_338 TaxID=2964704 RepID=UPI00286E51C5|nr:hypothetical protein [Chamaesiphon sp. VAR_69_metabat_338]